MILISMQSDHTLMIIVLVEHTIKRASADGVNVQRQDVSDKYGPAVVRRGWIGESVPGELWTQSSRIL